MYFRELRSLYTISAGVYRGIINGDTDGLGEERVDHRRLIDRSTVVIA